MNSGRRLPDCVYVAASGGDVRYTRTCVASVRYFYPDVPIRLLVSGDMQGGVTEELKEYWNAGVAELREKGDYGWGFVKLEPLFFAVGETFLVLDSDTVLTGPVLEAWSDSGAAFLVDDEKQSEADTKRLYYDWQKLRETDPCAQPPRFVFNSGQWFGTAGMLTRQDFAPWIEWTMPRRLRHPGLFMPGDQGVLNYVFNQRAALAGLEVERRQIMCWPAHSMEGLDAERVSRKAAQARIVHWAGLKKARQQDMLGADLLGFFERIYYERLPGGGARRVFAGCHASLTHYAVDTRLKLTLASRRLAMKGNRSAGK